MKRFHFYNPVIYFILLITLITMSCKKDWLNAKSNIATVIPSTLTDFQGLLDNNDVFILYNPVLGELGTDNYYLTYSNWESIGDNTERNTYIWAKDLYGGEISQYDWDMPYQSVFYANVVLEGLNNINPNPSTQVQWNNIKGSALFYRAFNFYNLLQEFAKPYSQNTANTDLGIPLRLHSDINIKSVRATVQQSYSQVLNDLLESEKLLPITPLYETRPSKSAVFGLLARTYLTMGNYGQALLYADSCIKVSPTLLDYNTIDSTQRYSFASENAETIFFCQLNNSAVFTRLIPDSILYSSYDGNDLRRSLFFDNTGATLRYKGSYTQSRVFFGGIAMDEIYLISSECNARLGNTAASMSDLNTLLLTRWRNGTYIKRTATDATDALTQILTERRKELIFRGLRWSDLRRLNTDPNYAVTLKRILNGTTYSLTPNSLDYVLPIPDDETQRSGIPQNPRQ